MSRLLFRPETAIYFALVAFTAVFFFFNALVGSDGQNLLGHYVKLNGSRIAWGVVLFLFASLLYIVVLWIKALFTQVDPLTIFTRRNILLFFAKVPILLKNLGAVGLPFLFVCSTLTMALGPLNSFNATRLRDELLFWWDTFLTGTFPPLSLASFQYPGWFVSLVESSFFNLVPVFVVFGAYLFVARQKLFREAAGAFSLAAMIMFAGWILFPVLSPHDRFIDNVYELPIFPEARSYVQEYHPQKEIEVFWEKINASREDLNVLPTTAFPSAHVAWAVLLVYYSYRVWKWLLIASLPLAILSTFGTNLFAAHYFVDIPAGLLCGGVSIFIARLFATRGNGEIARLEPIR